MKNYDDSDDPIQEVGGRSIFSKLKRFENDLEYNFQKEMEEFEKYLDEEEKKKASSANSNINPYNLNDNQESTYGNDYTNTNNLKNGYPIINFYIFIFIFVFFMIGFSGLFIVALIQEESDARIISETNLYTEGVTELDAENVTELDSEDEIKITSSTENKNTELKHEDLYNNIILSHLEFITFENGSEIPTLYKFDKETKADSCKYTESDPRYNKSANTIEINYDFIPKESLDILKKSLLARNYIFMNDDLGSEIYVLDTNDDHYVFVVVLGSTIIYGGGTGNYKYAFDL